MIQYSSISYHLMGFAVVTLHFVVHTLNWCWLSQMEVKCFSFIVWLVQWIV